MSGFGVEAWWSTLEDGTELSEITNCIPTIKTPFFREMHHFDFLAETVVADLKAGASIGRTKHVRLWSASCFTGEEAYSMAISLLEALRDTSSPETAIFQPSGWQIEVVASDSDAAVLATAAEGVYTEDSLDDLPAEAKKRYFLRGRGDMSGRVRVKQGVTDLVHFQPVALEDRDWTIEGPFDVIFFRNGLSQVKPEAQEPVLRKMLRNLKPHGYLILGHADSVPWLKDAASPIGNGIHQLRPRGLARYIGKERRRSPRSQRPVE